MKLLLRSLRDGFRCLSRHYGLVLLVWTVNLGLALLLALPFAALVERDLAGTGASSHMMYGFDYDWWSRWTAEAQGFAADFAPDLTGTGFALRNLELLLSGQVPGGLFASHLGVDAAVLGLGLIYLLLQTVLIGGILASFRSDAAWTVRGLFHAGGFYFGRLFRLSLLTLAAAGVVFALDAPIAGWLEQLAREAISERSALTLTFGRYALLSLALLLVHMVSSYAKVILVAEQRRSALLAFVSGAGFSVGHLGAVLGQYLVFGGIALGLLGLFSAADARLPVEGWRTQLVALGACQAFVVAGIALRLGLLAAQLALRRAVAVSAPKTVNTE